MQSIESQLNHMRQLISAAEQTGFNSNASVRLLAITKSQTIEKIQAAIAAGQKAFGENYLQEALTKIAALKNYALEWHFVGAIQSNKTRAIAENFSWVQTIENFRIAQRLNDQRPAHLLPLNVCIQVNISHEASKSGIHIDEVIALATQINTLPKLKLRGLMAIPAHDSAAQIHHDYQQMYNLFIKLQGLNFSIDTLSMGMTDDFKIAIAEGSTMVRIGTAIFGKR